jgi:hypothetical protein
MQVRLPENYVIPKSVLAAIRKVHPAPPPVYKYLMDDLLLEIMAPDAGDIEFEVPPYVLGYPLYDAEAVARWMASQLEAAGYSPEIASSNQKVGDMWPDRHESKGLEFPFEDAEYARALKARTWKIIFSVV